MGKRAQWKSRIGFMWAAIGSAIGLGSIWRFPYIVGQNGGAAFVLLFLICLFLVSLPVLMTEVLIGRKQQSSPHGSFRALGGKGWGYVGTMTIITGFIVSAFYAVISGFTLGYLIEAAFGHLIPLTTANLAGAYFARLVSSPYWSVTTLIAFMLISTGILYFGVQKGIEAKNKFLMPLLFVILLVLVIKGVSLPDAKKGLNFLFTPDWSLITPAAVLTALGQAFFGVSLGQGTMVTYGSYLSRKESIPSTCLPITLAVILVSLMAGIAIFTVVFSVGVTPDSGPALMYKTLPIVFAKIPGGYFVGVLFFLLIFLAALTSQISAMEPLIAYLMDEKNFSRHKAVATTGIGAFIIGLPCALSFGALSHIQIMGMNLFDFISETTINVLIPLGGLGAVILAAWKWGIKKAITELHVGASALFKRLPLVEGYLHFTIKYLAPVVIILVLLNSIGIL
ncbi:MAG: sodium-dependent transporter [Simkaniaceae bacterium]|nr:sodium-dependent transporter [Simkaniaceae bacterium]